MVNQEQAETLRLGYIWSQGSMVLKKKKKNYQLVAYIAFIVPIVLLDCRSSPCPSPHDELLHISNDRLAIRRTFLRP